MSSFKKEWSSYELARLELRSTHEKDPRRSFTSSLDCCNSFTDSAAVALLGNEDDSQGKTNDPRTCNARRKKYPTQTFGKSAVTRFPDRVSKTFLLTVANANVKLGDFKETERNQIWWLNIASSPLQKLKTKIQ